LFVVVGRPGIAIVRIGPVRRNEYKKERQESTTRANPKKVSLGIRLRCWEQQVEILAIVNASMVRRFAFIVVIFNLVVSNNWRTVVGAMGLRIGHLLF
jgi:hypothetical protein